MHGTYSVAFAYMRMRFCNSPSKVQSDRHAIKEMIYIQGFLILRIPACEGQCFFFDKTFLSYLRAMKKTSIKNNARQTWPADWFENPNEMFQKQNLVSAKGTTIGHT
jgi:hypothetical protein